MTFYELSICIRVYNNLKKDERRRTIEAVYLQESLHRTKRLPSLEKLIGDEQPKEPQTDSQMLEFIKRFNKEIGGEEV